MVTDNTVQQYAQAACAYFARAGLGSKTYLTLKNQLWTSFPGDPRAHDLILAIKHAAETVTDTKRWHLNHPDSATAEEQFINAVEALAKVTKQLSEHVMGVRV